MDIPIKADVNCSDGLFGQSTHIILMPKTEEITHIVVADRIYPEIEYLVSIDHIVYTTSELIGLNCTREELMKMPVFDQVMFIPSDNTMGVSQYMLWPYFYAPESAYFRIDKENIPANEIAIRRGAGVEATDGYIGRVDGFLMEPKDDRITHIILREGHLWGHKEVFIPVDLIGHYQDNTVYLKLDKHAIEALPGIPIWQGTAKKKS
jgi:PRC-barrel domain